MTLSLNSPSTMLAQTKYLPYPTTVRVPYNDAANCQSKTRALQHRAPATCGELVQGTLNGRDFLVNCPIDCYSTANVKTSMEPGVRIKDPANYSKIMRALELLGMSSAERGYEISMTSHIPRGKGMASSSADLAAAVTAVLKLDQRQLSDLELTRLIASVEPSDCVHLSDIAHVNHLTGEILEKLPAPTGLGVIVLDCGGEVDTTRFDRDRARAIYETKQSGVMVMRELLRYGLQNDNLSFIAKAATMSAKISQQIIPKPHFESLLAFAKAHGALGVNCAHSGTVVGVLYPIGDHIGESLLEHISRRFDGELEILGKHRVIGGGCS